MKEAMTIARLQCAHRMTGTVRWNGLVILKNNQFSTFVHFQFSPKDKSNLAPVLKIPCMLAVEKQTHNLFDVWRGMLEDFTKCLREAPSGNARGPGGSFESVWTMAKCSSCCIGCTRLRLKRRAPAELSHVVHSGLNDNPPFSEDSWPNTFAGQFDREMENSCSISTLPCRLE